MEYLKKVDMQTIRTFLALELGVYFQKELQQVINQLQPTRATVKWIDPAQAHITIHFFGDITLEQVENIKKCINPIVTQCSQIKLGLESIGVFHNIKNPRVVWVGLKGDTTPLSDLKKALDSELKKEGFLVAERAFKPHVTIGRIKDFKNDNAFSNTIAHYNITSTKTATVEGLTLFKSVLTKSGPMYTILEKIPFKNC